MGEQELRMRWNQKKRIPERQGGQVEKIYLDRGMGNQT